jgi:hypothetical protein
VSCPSEVPFKTDALTEQSARERSVKGYELSATADAGTYRVTAILHYRKVDQFLLNYMFGEDSGLTAPVIELDRATAEIRVVTQQAQDGSAQPLPRIGG